MATSMTFQVNDEGTGPSVVVTITENADGSLSFDVQVVGDYTGDLRGLFMDLADESLIGSLSVTDASEGLTEIQFGDDTIVNLGNGATMSGQLGGTGGTDSEGYDVGIEVGTSGIGADDYQTFSFTLSSTDRALTLDDFADVNFGARLTSVGDIDGDRSDSSKLLETTFKPVDAVDDATGCVDEDSTFSGNMLANDVGVGGKELVSVSLDGATYLFDGTNPIEIALGDTGAKVVIQANGDYTVDANDADALTAADHLSFDLTYTVKQTAYEADGSVAGTATDDATLNIMICGLDNDEPPPPPVAAYEGLSHGYWKTHTEEWSGMFGGQSFEQYFGVDLDKWTISSGKKAVTAKDVDFATALGLPGGDAAALAREAVAGVLNATREDVNYLYSIDEIKSLVVNAFATKDYTTAKDLLEAQNTLHLHDDVPLLGVTDPNDPLHIV